MRFIVSATTPGEIIRCRGMLAEWLPHGHSHLVCSPLSDLTEHPLRRRARFTSVRFIPVATDIYPALMRR
jgi:hypothetical protein